MRVSYNAGELGVNFNSYFCLVNKDWYTEAAKLSGLHTGRSCKANDLKVSRLRNDRAWGRHSV